MQTSKIEPLAEKHCVPCSGIVANFSAEQVQEHLQAINGWELTDNERRITKKWKVRNFLDGIEFFNQVALLAEEEGHHPDLHLEDYRFVRITLWTHATGGLTQNDFILAAKIDHLFIK